jgi:hypothetical protein
MLASSFLFLDFQSLRVGDPLSHDHAPSFAGAFDSKALSPPRYCSQCMEYSLRVSDLETRLTLAKC